MNHNNKIEKVVIWGVSGYALVVADIVALKNEYQIYGFIDNVNPKHMNFVKSNGAISNFISTNYYSLPRTEKLVSKVIQLPTGTAVVELNIDKICKLLQFVLFHGKVMRKLGI